MKNKAMRHVSLCLAAVGLSAMAFAQAQTAKPIPSDKSRTQFVVERPEIVLFSATPPGCRIVKGNFLSYRITGKVRTVEIFAIYKARPRRRIYHKNFEPFINGLSDSAISDPGMDRGTVRYLIRAQGPVDSRGTERSLDFRTPNPPVFRIATNVRIIDTIGTRTVRCEATVLSWVYIHRVIVRCPRRGSRPLLGAIGAADAGEPATRGAAIQITLYDLLDDRPEISAFPLESALILRHEALEMMKHHPLEHRPLRVPGTITPAMAEDASPETGQLQG